MYSFSLTISMYQGTKIAFKNALFLGFFKVEILAIFGSGTGFVNRRQSNPGFVNPVRSGPSFVNPIRSDPIRSGPGFVNTHLRAFLKMHFWQYFYIFVL